MYDSWFLLKLFLSDHSSEWSYLPMNSTLTKHLMGKPVACCTHKCCLHSDLSSHYRMFFWTWSKHLGAHINIRACSETSLIWSLITCPSWSGGLAWWQQHWSHQWSYAVLSLVSAEMGDHSWVVCKLTSHSGLKSPGIALLSSWDGKWAPAKDQWHVQKPAC